MFVDNEECRLHWVDVMDFMDVTDVEDEVFIFETSSIIEWPLGICTGHTSMPFNFESLGKSKRKIEFFKCRSFCCDQLLESADLIQN